MMGPALLWIHEPPNFWLRIGAFNLAMAIVVGAFGGIGTRALLVVYMDWTGGRGFSKMRALKGAEFLLLGALYGLFAWPMLKWDHPARILTAITILLPPIVACYRRSKGRAPSPPKLAARLLGAFLILVLLVAAMLTLLRAGFITLASDRVPLIVEITGESKSETIRTLGPPWGNRTVTTHRVIVYLPDGTPGADLWIPGDRVAFAGRAVLFSRRLNAMGFPNLYQFLNAQGGNPQGATSGMDLFLQPIPHTGPLAVHPWWAPIQAGILRAWPRAPEGTSPLLDVRIVENQSPFYPLLGKEGQPLKAHYLLDLTLDGIPTSRGSSPLENR
jgi:hypothetical protein